VDVNFCHGLTFANIFLMILMLIFYEIFYLFVNLIFNLVKKFIILTKFEHNFFYIRIISKILS
jgi:type IV secretory pathway VirB3-like protein